MSAGLIPSLVITAVVIGQVTSALQTEAEEKLLAVREAKGFQLEELYATMSGQVSSLAQNNSTLEASKSFISAFTSYEYESKKDINLAKSTLTSFYENGFGKKFNEENIGQRFDRASDLVSSLNKNKLLLQDAFISSNSKPLGAKDQLYGLDDQSTYSNVHKKYHPSFQTYLNKFGYYDIFIADAKSGDIIYSVFKEIDFATNLRNGMFAGSGIGEVYKRAINAKSKDDFFGIMTKLGVRTEQINYMKSKKTSALAVEINSKGANATIQGKTGFDIFPDYRDVTVLSAYRPLKIEGRDWYILSEMDESEALSSLYTVEKLIFTLIVISSIAIFALALVFARRIASTLVRLADNLMDGSKNVLESANALSHSSTSLSAATEEQAASLQETSASITEISAMIEKNSQNSDSTKSLSEESKAKAEEGKRYVSSVKSKIENIHKNNDDLVKNVEESNTEIENVTKIIEEISEKTRVINDIVFQTKLLSFNASVEAARAGEHGKGFAVVAEEIGGLASMSGKAAQEITDILGQSISQVHATVENSKSKMANSIEVGKKSVEESLNEIKVCDQVLSEILESFTKVDQSVEEIAASSSEQSAGVNEITTAIQQLDTVTQQNTTIAHTSSSKANELKTQSNMLSQIEEDIQMIVFGQKQSVSPRTKSQAQAPLKQKLALVNDDSIHPEDSRFKEVI